MPSDEIGMKDIAINNTIINHYHQPESPNIWWCLLMTSIAPLLEWALSALN